MDYNKAGSRQQAAGSRQQAAGSRQQAAGTLPVQRDIILTGRNLQALARLHYDIHPLLETDPRLQIHYTITPGSQFRNNTKRFTQVIPHEILPWEEAQALQADLAISASANRDLYTLSPQLMLLPHGAGHSRKVGTIPGASGLSPEQLIGPNRELPAALALPGPAAQNRLAIDCPSATDRAHLIGDICLERLRLSQKCRDEYRRHLGVGDRTLVLFSSTWGPHSAYSTFPDLPRKLHNSLPADDFMVAFVPHPNIEAEYQGPLPNLHRPYFANGLFMPRPEEGWRALVLAADIVIGDHGSVTVYAAALDKPLGMAAFGSVEVTENEPLSELAKAAPGFDPDAELVSHINDMISAHVPGQYQQWSEQILTEPTVPPSETLRDVMYELINLPLPQYRWKPELFANPNPAEGYRSTTAWICDIAIDAGTVTWQRYPISLKRRGTPASNDAHTVTELSSRRPEWRDNAAILLRHTETLPPDEAIKDLERIFSDYVSSEIASVRTGPARVLIGSPKTPGNPAQALVLVEATAEENSLTPTALDLTPSALYRWKSTRNESTIPDQLTFKRGKQSCVITFTQQSSASSPNEIPAR